MTSDSERVSRLASVLKAESFRYGSPKADRGLLVPPIWLFELGPFESWTELRTWELCFGKASRCLVDPDDLTTTACAEAIVARRLGAAGFEAGWLNTYRNAGPAHWTPRMDAAVARDLVATRLPALAARIGQKGTPDVFGSDGEAFVFVEVKRHPDQLNKDQVGWIETALGDGLDHSQMLLATWTGIQR